MSETGFIYGLGTASEGIRYVGLTQKPIKTRFLGHARSAKGGSKYHVHSWWRSLTSAPEIFVLEVCPVEQLADREVAWIAALRRHGARLCNHTSGGQGGTPDEPTRAKLRAAARRRSDDPDYIERLRIANKKRWSDPEERKRASERALVTFGGEDYRALRSRIAKARYTDEQEREMARERTREAWAKLTPAERAERGAAMSRGRKAARQ